MKSLITKLVVVFSLLFVSTEGFAQLTADPLVSGAIIGASKMEKDALNGIETEQSLIVKAQTAINIGVRKLQ